MYIQGLIQELIKNNENIHSEPEKNPISVIRNPECNKRLVLLIVKIIHKVITDVPLGIIQIY